MTFISPWDGHSVRNPGVLVDRSGPVPSVAGVFPLSDISGLVTGNGITQSLLGRSWRFSAEGLEDTVKLRDRLSALYPCSHRRQEIHTQYGTV